MIHKEEIPDSMLFAGIHPEEKESILKCLSAVEKKYEKGDIIFLAGTEIRSMVSSQEESRSPGTISGETGRFWDMEKPVSFSVKLTPVCRVKFDGQCSGGRKEPDLIFRPRKDLKCLHTGHVRITIA
mgnify:CR=1 FL=1